MAVRRKVAAKKAPAKKKVSRKRASSAATLAPSETEIGRLAIRFEAMETNMRLFAEGLVGFEERQTAQREADRAHVDARFDVLEALVRSQSTDLRQLLVAVTENSADIRQLQVAVTENSADIRQLQAAVAENSADIRQNSADIRQLQVAVAENSADIRQNSADIRQNGSDIRELQGAVARIEANMATKSDLAALDDRVRRLEEHLPTGT